MPTVYINDDNYGQFINPVVDGEIKRCASYGMFPPGFGALPSFADQDDVSLIPESEWDEHIRQLEKDQATLLDLVNDCKLDCLDQDGTNYCWANGVTYAAMVARLKESGQVVRLSPASVAAPIKRFRNQGGWGAEALDFMIANGINTQDDWPANEWRNQSLYNAENKEKAKRNIVAECFRCDSFGEVVSAILAGFPVAVGFNWWGHLVCGIRVSLGAHDLGIMNSWGQNWGQNGFGWLQGSKKRPDMVSVAIRSMVAA